MAAGRRWARRLWPVVPVTASWRLGDGRVVRAGDYRCPRDHHPVTINFDDGSGNCPACGRRFTLMFPGDEYEGLRYPVAKESR